MEGEAMHGRGSSCVRGLLGFALLGILAGCGADLGVLHPDTVLFNGRSVHAVTYLKNFLFSPDRARSPITHLSGGERNRVHLAKVLKAGSNVLLLDEPTNDLDVETLRALEEALLDFPGCVVVISHDRWFLDRIATHILAFEGDSQIEFFAGNYQDYEKDRKRRLGDAADRPDRIRYKPLAS